MWAPGSSSILGLEVGHRLEQRVILHIPQSSAQPDLLKIMVASHAELGDDHWLLESCYPPVFFVHLLTERSDFVIVSQIKLWEPKHR